MTVAALGVNTPATAAPLIGTLGISGGIVYDTLNTTGGAILDFTPLGTGVGQFVDVGIATGYFDTVLGLGIGDTGQILDLTNLASAAGVPGPVYAPPGVPNLGIDDFLSAFTGAAGLTFELSQVVLQSGTPCTGSEGLGDTCVIGPFSISQTNLGVRIAFDILGWFINGSDSGFYSGAFSTTFRGRTFADLFAALATGSDFTCAANQPVYRLGSVLVGCQLRADHADSGACQSAPLRHRRCASGCRRSGQGSEEGESLT
jgi:hypothetical protein